MAGRWGISVAFAVFAVLSTPVSFAADSQTQAAVSADLQNIYLAAELAAKGRERKDPVLLIAAARLLDGIESSPSAMKAEVSGGSADAAGAPPARELTADSLREEARALAPGDQTIAILAQPPVGGSGGSDFRGAGGGPKFHRQTVGRGARATFRADFRGQEIAEVVVVGSQTADLDLVVLDEKRAVVCVSRNPTDYERCRWTPPKNGQYFMVVENRGSWTNLFSIYTN